ncbi:MAG: sugar phosphate isomerase/epimerase [Pirellulales bacterium]
MKQPTRRSFLKTTAAIAGGSAIRGRRVLAAEAEANKPRVRPNILYALSTGCWGPVTPRGKPLPLVKILDETAAGGFNGVRLTGFPGILEQNHLTVEQYGDELASRGLKFSTVSFGGEYRDPEKHAEIRERARFALATHKRYGAKAMVFFPSGPVPESEEADVMNKTFRFLNELGKMAVEDFGIRMGLHNHTNSLVENQQQVDRFLEGTDPRYVFCAWDSAHLLLGGCDVQKTYEKSIDRLVYTDFKDATLNPTTEDYVAPNGQRYAGDSDSGRFYNSILELGRGQIDFVPLMKLLKDHKYQGWVNQDIDTIRVSIAESNRIAMSYITGMLDPIYE